MLQSTNECNIDDEKKRFGWNKKRGRDLLLLPSFEIEIMCKYERIKMYRNYRNVMSNYRNINN